MENLERAAGGVQYPSSISAPRQLNEGISTTSYHSAKPRSAYSTWREEPRFMELVVRVRVITVDASSIDSAYCPFGRTRREQQRCLIHSNKIIRASAHIWTTRTRANCSLKISHLLQHFTMPSFLRPSRSPKAGKSPRRTPKVQIHS